eukprot:30904-Pelagococcus_subviridis.AAC.6
MGTTDVDDALRPRRVFLVRGQPRVPEIHALAHAPELFLEDVRVQVRGRDAHLFAASAEPVHDGRAKFNRATQRERRRNLEYVKGPSGRVFHARGGGRAALARDAEEIEPAHLLPVRRGDRGGEGFTLGSASAASLTISSPSSSYSGRVRDDTTTRVPGRPRSVARRIASAGSRLRASVSLKTITNRTPGALPDAPNSSNASAARSSIARETSITRTCVAPFSNSALASFPVSAPTTRHRVWSGASEAASEASESPRSLSASRATNAARSISSGSVHSTHPATRSSLRAASSASIAAAAVVDATRRDASGGGVARRRDDDEKSLGSDDGDDRRRAVAAATRREEEEDDDARDSAREAAAAASGATLATAVATVILSPARVKVRRERARAS